MAIDGSIIQFRDELNGNATVYPLTCQSAVLGEDSQPLQTYITEYNVSHHHTNKATSQSNPNYDSSIFTLNEAITTVPVEYQRGGLKLSFNSVNGGVESYTLDSSVWKIDPKYWKRFDANDFNEKLTELEIEIGEYIGESLKGHKRSTHKPILKSVFEGDDDNKESEKDSEDVGADDADSDKDGEKTEGVE